MNHRGKATPASPATATVMTTGSAMSPMNALGNPKRFACHVEATAPQEILDERSHANVAAGFAASVIASADSTREAISPSTLETSISE